MHPRRSVANANFAALQTELVGLLRGVRAQAPSVAQEKKRDSSSA